MAVVIRAVRRPPKLPRMNTGTPNTPSPAHPVLRFVHRGQSKALPGIAPHRTLLAVLREDLGKKAAVRVTAVRAPWC